MEKNFEIFGFTIKRIAKKRIRKYLIFAYNKLFS